MSKLICHYTNEKGFKGIIKSKSFHLCSSITMNDPTDRIHGTDCVKKAISLSQSGDFLYQFKGIKFDDSMIPLYTMCFCENNNGYLWQEYADNHRGFGIVTNSDLLVKNLTNDEYNPLRFYQVRYGSQREYIEQVARDVHSRFGLDRNNELHQDSRVIFLLNIVNSICSGYIKCCLWQEEREYRLSYMDVTDVGHSKAKEYDNTMQIIMRNLHYINHLSWLNELQISHQHKKYRIGSGKRKYYYPQIGRASCRERV